MTIAEPSFPYFTWGCADDLEGRLKKTLYHGGKNDCIGTVSSAALTDVAVSAFIAAAPSPKRRLRPGYICSISKRLAINPCTMMLGILYCERLRQINPDYLNKISSSDLFIVSLVVASKFLNDEGEEDEIFNDEWAEAGGLGVSTVNRLEIEFLNAMHWRAYVSPKDFLQFCNRLETSIALKHGLERGWFSYTDLTNILAQMHFFEAIITCIHKVFKVFLSCTLVYGISIGVLMSAILCVHASLNAKHVSSNDTGIPNSIHPFADREITRVRTTNVDISPSVSNGSSTQTVCTCEGQNFKGYNDGNCEKRCPKLSRQEKSNNPCFHGSRNVTSTAGIVKCFENEATNQNKTNPGYEHWSEGISNDELTPKQGFDSMRHCGITRLKNVEGTSNRFISTPSFQGLLDVFKQPNKSVHFEKQMYPLNLFHLKKLPTVGTSLLLDKGPKISFVFSGSRLT